MPRVPTFHAFVWYSSFQANHIDNGMNHCPPTLFKQVYGGKYKDTVLPVSDHMNTLTSNIAGSSSSNNIESF